MAVSLGNYSVGSYQMPYLRGSCPMLSNLSISVRPLGSGEIFMFSGNTNIENSNENTALYNVSTGYTSSIFRAEVGNIDYYKTMNSYSDSGWYNYPIEFVAEWESNIIPVSLYGQSVDYNLVREYYVTPNLSDDEFAFDYGVLCSFATAGDDYIYADSVTKFTYIVDGSSTSITCNLAELMPNIDTLRANNAVLVNSKGDEQVIIKSLLFYEQRNSYYDYIGVGQKVEHTLYNLNRWSYSDKIAFYGEQYSTVEYIELNPTEMLFQPLESFLSFELMPGLSVTTLFIVALAVGVFGVFLKFYAGG